MIRAEEMYAMSKQQAQTICEGLLENIEVRLREAAQLGYWGAVVNLGIEHATTGGGTIYTCYPPACI